MTTVSWFDELRTEDGRERWPYEALRERAGWDPTRPDPEVARQLVDRPLGDDARILPVPIVLDDTEYRTRIQAGVAQRARALHALFSDLVLGAGEFLTPDIGLDRGLLDDILAAEGTSRSRLREQWDGHSAEQIRFVYGPDLVRAPDGGWRVLEDNVGCVGGSADGHAVSSRYRQVTSLPSCPACRREPDLAVALMGWLTRTGRESGPVVAVLGCEPGSAPRVDENGRRRAILSSLGIRVIERADLDSAVSTGGPPVTIINFDVDDTYLDIFGAPRVALMTAPGIGILGNKALLPVVDALISVTTGEAPILPTPPTKLLDGNALPATPQHWVAKSTTGRQGTEVMLLGPDSSMEEIVRHLPSGPARVVLQRYVEPSRIVPIESAGWGGYRVELRPLAYVLDGDDVFVSEVPVGRGVSVYDTRQLNNISQGACYVPVLREPCPGCATRR